MRSKLQTFTYEYKWEVVSFAYMQRYPVHPRLPVMLSSEIKSQQTVFDKETGRTLTVVNREVTVDVEAPAWLKRSFSTYSFTFAQKTTIDPVGRKMWMDIHNITHADKVKIVETCCYRVHDDNPEWTWFEQQADLQLPSWVPFGKQIEKFMAASYDKNTAKGRAIDLVFVAEVLEDGSFAKSIGKKIQAERWRDLPEEVAPAAPALPAAAGDETSTTESAAATPAEVATTTTAATAVHSHHAPPPPLNLSTTLHPPARQIAAVSPQLAIVSMAAVPLVAIIVYVFGNTYLAAGLALIGVALGSLFYVVGIPNRQKPPLNSTETAPLPSTPTRDLIMEVPLPPPTPKPAVIAQMTTEAPPATPAIVEELSLEVKSISVPCWYEHVFGMQRTILFGVLAETSNGKTVVFREYDDFVRLSSLLEQLARNMPPSKSVSSSNLFGGRPSNAQQPVLKLPPFNPATSFGKSTEVNTIRQALDQYLVSFINDPVAKKCSLLELFLARYQQPQFDRTCACFGTGFHTDSGSSPDGGGSPTANALPRPRAQTEAPLPNNATQRSDRIVELQEPMDKKVFPVPIGSEGIRKQGGLARARRLQEFCDEWVQVTMSSITLFRYRARAADEVIPLTDVLSVHEVCACRVPLPGVFYFEVETLYRVYLFACDSLVEGREWMKVIRVAVLAAESTRPRSRSLDSTGNTISAAKTTSDRPVAWACFPDCGDRMVLNVRRVLPLPPVKSIEDDKTASSTSTSTPATVRSQSAHPSAYELVKRLLTQVLMLHTEFSQMPWDVRDRDRRFQLQMTAFLDDCSLLRTITLPSHIPHDELLAMLLSLHNCIVVHAHLVMNFPSGGPTPVRTFMRQITYEIAGLLLSPSEIEHCLLRFPVSRPAIYFSYAPALFSPEDPRSRLALKEPEPLVSFALINGTTSGLRLVWIFDRRRVHEQLRAAAGAYVEEHIIIDVEQKSVRLPRICMWYANDFGNKKHAILLAMAELLTQRRRASLEGMINRGVKINISYDQYIWTQNRLPFAMIDYGSSEQTES